jgi:hypothetical protein
MPSPPGPPMTLGNMRELGVRSIAVTCELCHHQAVLPADRWSDAVLVSAFRPRMVCTRCGIIGADARPRRRENEYPRRAASRQDAYGIDHYGGRQAYSHDHILDRRVEKRQ